MTRKKLKRVYKPYYEWEEIRFNMWGEVDNKNDYLELAILFTSDHVLYGQYMMRVIDEWSVSCENALTDLSMNRKAWVGHAAVSLAIQCPEDITRKAWGYLTDEQRFLANREAERTINKWEIIYRKNNQLYQDMESPMLF